MIISNIKWGDILLHPSQCPVCKTQIMLSFSGPFSSSKNISIIDWENKKFNVNYTRRGITTTCNIEFNQSLADFYKEWLSQSYADPPYIFVIKCPYNCYTATYDINQYNISLINRLPERKSLELWEILLSESCRIPDGDTIYLVDRDRLGLTQITIDKKVKSLLEDHFTFASSMNNIIVSHWPQPKLNIIKIGLQDRKTYLAFNKETIKAIVAFS